METEWGWRNSSWKCNSTWRSEFRWDDVILSPAMRGSLKELLLERKPSGRIPSRTLKALRNRKLVDENDKLTEAGIVVGLKHLPLKKQCEYLGLEIETPNIERNYADPAVDMLFHFKRNGHNCTYCEGISVRKVIFCLYAHELIEIPIKKGVNSFFDGLSTYPFSVGLDIFLNEDSIYDYKSLTAKLLHSIDGCTREIFLLNYRSLFPKGYCWLGVDELFASQLYDILGLDTLKGIAAAIFLDPYSFYKGWPDLTIVKDRSIEFVEIKTSDKLHESQLITFPYLKENCNINIKIIKASKS